MSRLLGSAPRPTSLSPTAAPRPRCPTLGAVACLCLVTAGPEALRADPAAAPGPKARPAPSSLANCATPPRVKARPAPSSLANCATPPRVKARPAPPLSANRATPPRRRTAPAPAPAIPAGAARKRALRASAPYRVALGLGVSAGGFYAPSAGWVRQDVGVRLRVGVRLHRLVEAIAALSSSAERMMVGVRAGVRLFPWTQGLYAKLELASRLAGTGVQVGLGAGVGFSWAFSFRVGCFAALETSGWLTWPRAFTLGAQGGVFVWF